MSDNILLKKIAAGNWIWDSANSKYYLEINGTKVAEMDANGHLRIKGDIMTNENIT